MSKSGGFLGRRSLPTRTCLHKSEPSFVVLVHQERQTKAFWILSAFQLAIEDVVAQLGYSTVSNFVRAFHRWTGQTPAAYGRTRRASHPPAKVPAPVRRSPPGSEPAG